MMFFTLPSIVALSILFLSATNPLSMGVLLLAQTIMISASTGFLAHSFWFSYILFLIFLGGMLVLFIYVTSVASNEQFSFSLKSLVFIGSGISLIFFFLLAVDPNITAHKIMMFSSSILPSLNFSSPATQTSMLYNLPTFYLTAFIVVYLLLTLFVIVKIMNTSSSPLRLSS